ncbi:unnamed protein product [Adineta steineri]|uniref:Peptidase M12B domain-containing protein n=1 Tax=Adineta steineri TaxID=433720 RepID=A0A818L616_9BILA|nr:unnamed protein product [Adineta steineri]
MNMSKNIATVDQEQFIYEIVIPQSLRSSRSSSFVPDWKARLRDKDQSYPSPDIRHKHSLETFINHTNTTLYYRINGFNQTFDLTLIEDEAFLAPSFTTQHFDQDHTWLTRDIEHCFYKGYINQNPLSTVSISLCHGLLGTFVYNDVEYFIEPKHHENETKWNYEHLFYTHKDSILSITDNPQTVRCPVNGVPYFEKETSYPHYHRSRKRRFRKSSKNIPSNLPTNYVEDNLAYHVKRRAKRQHDFDPTAKHVEILVAYDESIKSFHSDADIKSYILTLFSYVSHLYSDASIGNNIKIWLVKLVDLGKPFTDYIQSSDDAADTLSRFCTWQKDYNAEDTYDAAVLLTRTPLCNKRAKNVTDSKCDTLGLTELGTLCNKTSKCAVVRDNGFATAFTIAHEIAHLFGIRHDNDKACLDHTKEQNLMATSLTFNYNHYKWSNCSRHYFTQYLESERFKCLNNVPDYRSLSFKDLNDEQKARELPGSFSDLNDQCRRAFGVTFEYCTDLGFGPKCNRLYCREMYSNLSSCITNHAHWSDGTMCSEPRTEIKRCFRGQCRSALDLQVVNGNWGDWHAWSPCTRTCGSAVQKSQRFCDNPKPQNGGQYCSGQSTRIQSCEDNPPCKDPIDMFRQRQCSVFNNRTIDPSLPIGVRFEPKYNVLPGERCKLICKVTDDRLERSFVLGDRVEDGTPCGREEDTRDICISGICMPIGCDQKYGSNATEDVCGVCNGQNRTCRSYNGQTPVSAFGITNIIDIPSNTTRVSVTQISAGNDRYYLAVKHINGTYILNGMHSLQLYNVKIRIGGATLAYTGSDSGNETVLITGRLKVPLEIQVISIYQAGAPATLVDWEYYSPLDEINLARQYGDESSDYHCDRPCQGFKQTQKCLIHGREYELIYCSTYRIPYTYGQERCNDDCVLSWTTRYQQACSTRCGDGYKRVIYECTKTSYTKGNMESMDEDTCRKYVGEKPKDVVSCVGDCTGSGWVYGNWGECHYNDGCVRKRSAECRNSSNLPIPTHYCVPDFIFNTERCADASCDQSRWNYTSWSDCDCTLKRRRRSVTCVRYGKPVNDRDCIHEPKPDETVSCDDECSTAAHWETHAWQPCTATCSSHKGIRRRHVVCSHHGSTVQDAYCDQRSKPVQQEWCSTNVSCTTWSLSEWSSCSVTCGTGIQRRTVLCNQDGRAMDKSKCPQPMPIEQQTCTASSSTLCATLRWSTGPWDDCSATCGTGIQQRSVYCDDPSRAWIRIPDSECITMLGERTKPTHRQNCSIASCPSWQLSPWGKCSGKCGSAERHRRVWCSYNEREVDDNYCTQSGEVPLKTEICHVDLYCPQWTTGMWSECSGPLCSTGMQYRQVVCRQGHETISNIHCDEALRPLELQACHMPNNTACSNVRAISIAESTSSYIWDVKQFGECSTTCGIGRRLRQVHCVDSSTKMSYDDKYCAQLPRKPVDQEICNLNPCPTWFTDPWSPCPVTCGTGMQHRLVMCKNREEMVSPEKCNGLNRPETTKQCYTIPCRTGTGKDNNISPATATWIPSEWAQCDLQTCTQKRTVRCIDAMNGRILPMWDCSQNQPQPLTNRICPISTCIEWRVAHWNGCSVTCGRGIEIGFGLNCFARQMPIRKINASECELAEPHLPKPTARRECRRTCVDWRTSNWSECDNKCGTGKRFRQVTCHRKLTGQQVADRFCLQKRRNLTRPISEEICTKQSCYKWSPTDQWTSCSAMCNGGYEDNIARCVTTIDPIEQTVHDQLCNDTIRPQIRRSCNIKPCVPKPYNVTRRRGRRRRWEVGLWSPCNVPCGVGEQNRTIQCLAIFRNRTLNDRFCRHLPKPNLIQQCFQIACTPMWATNVWSSCSSQCGLGYEYRGISCHEVNNNGYLLKNNYTTQCNQYRAPTTRISCNMGDCESPYVWHVEPWSKCSSDCNRGEQTRHIYCKNRQSSLRVDDRFCKPHKPVTRIDCYGFLFEHDQSTKR